MNFNSKNLCVNTEVGIIMYHVITLSEKVFFLLFLENTASNQLLWPRTRMQLLDDNEGWFVAKSIQGRNLISTTSSALRYLASVHSWNDQCLSYSKYFRQVSFEYVIIICARVTIHLFNISWKYFYSHII